MPTKIWQKTYLINSNILGSFCPFPLKPTLGQPCSVPAALECQYHSDVCCCGYCEDEVFYCASDSTTGSGLWQLRNVCPAGCKEGELLFQTQFPAGPLLQFNLQIFHTGNVTSPNHPGNYPPSLGTTATIQVEEGFVILLQFTVFHTHNCNDRLTITDGDGTTLLGRACGSSLPNKIKSSSNFIEMFFKTDSKDTQKGWSANWIAVTAGK